MVDAFWHGVTRSGEGLILLPAAIVLALWLARCTGGRRLAGGWLLMVSLAVLVTTATKLAFIGWGLGSAALNFTGVSGHAMFAAGVYPVLMRTASSTASSRWHRASVLAGVVLAVLIGVSRVRVGAHSWSEVLAGLALGGAASGAALLWARVPRSPAPRWLVVGVLAWLLAMPIGAPPSPTHGWVTGLALALSGRATPYTREDLLRDRGRGRYLEAAHSGAPTGATVR